MLLRIKYFIGYKDAKKQAISTYKSDFDETKYMSFLIKHGE